MQQVKPSPDTLEISLNNGHCYLLDAKGLQNAQNI